MAKIRPHRPLRRAEIPALVQTLASVLAQGHERLVSLFTADFARDPSLDPADSAVVREHGVIVANVTVYGKPLRFGAATVPTGCIGNVACLAEHRGKGYASQCVRDALALMRGRGMPFALLLGIDRYYTRFGFIGCQPHWKLTLQCRDLTMPRSALRAVAYRPRDLPELMQLERLASAGVALTVARDRARWRYALERNGLLAGEEPALMTFRDRRAIRAYAIWKDGWLWEAGMAPGDDEACAAVLTWLRDRRVAASERALTLDNCSPAHPLWRYATRFSHGIASGLYYTAGCMGCIVDPAAFVKLLMEEFTARVRLAGIDGGFRLDLTVDGEALVVEVPGAKPRRARVVCTQQDLLLITLGVSAPVDRPRLRMSGDAPLLRALFPPGAPCLYKADHF